MQAELKIEAKSSVFEQVGKENFDAVAGFKIRETEGG